jgi:[NiFe] hydrogenase assembly HybE family chaperone
MTETARAVGERLAALYRTISDGAMRDVPIVNPALAVEAVGFRPHGGWVAGVLVTPWFMNLVLVPGPGGAMLPAVGGGDSWMAPFPVGEIALTVGVLDGFGRLDCASLFSPMQAFPDPETARAVALSAIETVFIAPAQAPLDRRSLLFGQKAAAR